MTDPIIIPTQEVGPLREGDSFSPVGNLFAPFFDVVFYSVDAQEGEVTPVKEGAKEEDFGGATISGTTETSKLGASRLQIRSNGGLTSYSPEGEDGPVGQLRNYASNLQVSMVSSKALQATLTLSPPYEVAVKIVDHQLIRFGNLMEIQWGYLALDGGAPIISDKGLFTIVQPSIKFGKETQVVIAGFDILSNSLGTTDTRRRWTRDSYESDLDIIREIVEKRVGIGAKLNDLGLRKDSRLRKKKARAIIQASDDWVFFRRLLRHNNVEFLQKGTEVQLNDLSSISAAKPKYRLVWFMQPENEKDIPMITFETNPYASLFSSTPGARGQRTVSSDAATGKVEQTDKDPGDTGVAQPGPPNTNTTNAAHKTEPMRVSGSGTSVATNAEINTANASGLVTSQPGNLPNKEEEADRANVETRVYYNSHATATCLGVPGMVPQKTVEVVNVGNKFSTNYRVIKVVHNIGVGYTMSINLINSASDGDEGSGAPASRDKAGTEPVDPKADTTETATPTKEETSSVEPRRAGQRLV